MSEGKRTVYESRFNLGDKVKVDGMDDSHFIITALLWRGSTMQYEISWFSDGANTAWIEDWRLEPWSD